MRWRHMIQNPLFWTTAWTAFLLSSFFIWLFWYLIIFTPVHILQSSVVLDGRDFTVTVFSHKTFLANTLCKKPIIDATVIAFEDFNQNHASVIDNAKGRGNGDEKVRKWVSTGRIPENIESGSIVVWKRLLYLCVGGIVKEVESPEMHVMLPPD